MKRRRMTKKKYKEAFRIACELLNGDWLYGHSENTIYHECMEKDHCVSALSYMDFILDHLNELSGRGCK